MQINGIDEKDSKILELLKANARLSYSEIGEVVELSRTAVKSRITALEKAGIIQGYHAKINELPTSTLTFVVNIETKPEHFEDARTFFAEANDTITLLHTTGNCHLLALCASESIDTMRAYVKNVYNCVPGIVSINAHSILEVIKGKL